MPLVTAVAAPPLDPPALRLDHTDYSQPPELASVIFLNPNSGIFVRPTIINPALPDASQLSVRFIDVFNSLLLQLDGSPR